MPLPSPNSPSSTSAPTPNSAAQLEQAEGARGARKDPQARGIDAGWTAFNDLVNRDPALNYVWISLRDEDTGVGLYQAQGYEECRHEPDGVRPAALRKPTIGAPIEWRGQLLMAIPKDQHAALVAAGDRRTEMIESHLRRHNSLIDNSRGVRAMTLNNQYMAVQDSARFES